MGLKSSMLSFLLGSKLFAVGIDTSGKIQPQEQRTLPWRFCERAAYLAL